MTNSIVQKIFANRANATQALIVKHKDDIVAECKALQAILDANKGTDAKRDAIMDDGQFAWLYDEMGKPNKKGVSKPTMGDLNRGIRGGMLFVAEQSELFLAWAETEGMNKKGVCDFNNIKKAITPKPIKAEKAPLQASESGTGEGETETGEAVALPAPSAPTLEMLYDALDLLPLKEKVAIRDYLIEAIGTEQDELKKAV